MFTSGGMIGMYPGEGKADREQRSAIYVGRDSEKTGWTSDEEKAETMIHAYTLKIADPVILGKENRSTDN